jgi:hypothetical protein
MMMVMMRRMMVMMMISRRWAGWMMMMSRWWAAVMWSRSRHTIHFLSGKRQITSHTDHVPDGVRIQVQTDDADHDMDHDAVVVAELDDGAVRAVAVAPDDVGHEGVRDAARDAVHDVVRVQNQVF